MKTSSKVEIHCRALVQLVLEVQATTLRAEHARTHHEGNLEAVQGSFGLHLHGDEASVEVQLDCSGHEPESLSLSTPASAIYRQWFEAIMEAEKAHKLGAV